MNNELPTKQDLEELHALDRECPICGESTGCRFLCPNSPDYMSYEQERQAALEQESWSEAEYMSMAVAQYEREHGHSPF